MSSFLNMEGEDFAAFVIASLVGYFLGTLMPAGTWAIFTALFVSYHLFLGWLVFGGKHNAGVSLPVGMTLLTHLCCLIVIIVPVAATRHVVSGFGLFRYAIVALAVFERGWLFSGASEKAKVAPEETVVPVDAGPAPVTLEERGQESEAWRKYLETRKATQRRPGMSLKAEHAEWLVKYRKQAADKGEPVSR